MPPKKDHRVRRADRPSAWKLNELIRELVAWWCSKYIKYKDESKLIKQDGERKDIDPFTLPSNVVSKGHWASAELAISESTCLYIDRESLKAYGGEILRLIKKYKEHTNALGEHDPWPNTATPERQAETRKKIEAEFPSLRSASPAPEGDEKMDTDTSDSGDSSSGKKRKLSASSASTATATSTPRSLSLGSPSLAGPARSSSFRPVTPDSTVGAISGEQQGMMLTYNRQTVELLGKIWAVVAEMHNEYKKDKASKLRGALQSLDGKKKQQKPRDKGKGLASDDEADGLAGEVAAAVAKSKDKDKKGKGKKGKGKDKGKSSKDEDDSGDESPEIF